MADEVKVKSVLCFHLVKHPSRCIIHSLTSCKDKELVILSTGGRFLYLIDNEQISNTILFPCRVTHFVVRAQLIIAASEDGKVWQVPVSRTHNVKQTTKPTNQECKEKTLSSNQNIFSELLSDDKTAIKQSSVHVTEVSTSQVILYEPNIQAIFSLEDLLICVGYDSEYTISLYKPDCCHGDDMSYSALPPYRFFLKGVTSSHDAWPLPVLCKNQGSSDADNVLEKKLFDVLLPSCSHMDITSMLLVGSPEGHVWSCNVTPHDDTRSRFELVWHLNEPVVAICLATISIPTPNNTSITSGSGHDTCKKNVVLVVGKRGKCVIIYHGSKKCVYSESNICGPVVCCSSTKDYILYSNRKEVCMEKLSFVTSDNTEPSIVLMPLSITTIADVIAICPLKLCNDVVKVAALTLHGKLIEATLPTSHSKTTFDVCLEQPGNQLKDLLLSIENVALQTVLLEKDLESIDKVLEQLNQAASVICKITSDSGDTQSSNSIEWTVVPQLLSTRDASNTNRYYLSFKIQNQSKVLLADCWSLLVQIRACSSYNICAKTALTMSHSVSMDSLEHMKMKEFSIFLPSDFNLLQCLSVEVCLCCNLQTLLLKLPSNIQHDIGVNKHSVLMSVGHVAIDVLDFAAISLVEINLALCRFSAAIQPSHLDNLERFCQDMNTNVTGKSYAADVHDQETITVPLCSEMVTCISAIVQSTLDRSPAQTHTTISHELCVVYFLLGYSNGTLEVISPEVNPCSKAISKHVLTVEVKRVEQGVHVVLQAPSKMAVYSLLEAVIIRIKSFVIHCCSTNQINVSSLQGTLQSIEAIKSIVIPPEFLDKTVI